jgi:hypothetical protein
MEKGAANVTINTLVAVATAYGLDLADLLREE